MAGAFDALLTEGEGSAIDYMPTLGADGRMGRIDPTVLKQILALRENGYWTGANAGGNLNAAQQWYDPNVEGNNGWRLQYQPGVNFNYDTQGMDARPTLDPSRDMRAITKIRENTGGKLGDWWNEDGTYGGTFEAQDGGGRQFNTAALMFGATLGGNLAMANNGAGATAATTSGAGTVAQSSATKAALLGNAGYGTGMTGLQTSIFDGVLQATGSTQLANGAATIASSGGDWTNWLKTAWDGADQFLNSGWGKALVTAGGLAMTKDAKQGAPDPMLKEGADGVKDIAKDAKDRAASADEEWNSIFMPRYLGLMDRADRRDQELYDFNMGRARLAARQMDRFYSQVDAYDDEGNRERLAGEAGATAEQNNSAGMEQMRRNIGRMGFNPNSGVMLSQMRQGTQQGALNKTLAMNMAREAARREGLNLRATAAGLRGADSAYAGNAAAGADIGLRGTAAGQQGFSNRNADWRGNMGLGMQGYGQLGSWGLGRSNSADQLNAANVAGWNGLIGYGLGSLWNQPARKG